jgi:hypothetical protein
MKKSSLLVTISSLFLIGLTGGTAFAADPAATVTFTLKANQPTLRDDKAEDTFNITLQDAKVTTQLALQCSAGRSKFLGLMQQDEACNVGGNGSVNASGMKPRTQYLGGFKVDSKSGYVDASTIEANYLVVGQAPAGTAKFGGSLILTPENPNSSMLAFTKHLVDKIKDKADAGVKVDEHVDIIALNGFTTPSAGFPSDKGCSWTGQEAFSYQTNSWYIDVTGSCSGKDYHLVGNMPWTSTPNVANQTQYDLNVTVPSTSITSDDALFQSQGGSDDAMFAAADGITGQIIMKGSDLVVVKDGEDPVPVNVDASGSFNGTNVPLEVVRSFATLIGILPSTFFGA